MDEPPNWLIVVVPYQRSISFAFLIEYPWEPWVGLCPLSFGFDFILSAAALVDRWILHAACGRRKGNECVRYRFHLRLPAKPLWKRSAAPYGSICPRRAGRVHAFHYPLGLALWKIIKWLAKGSVPMLECYWYDYLPWCSVFLLSIGCEVQIALIFSFPMRSSRWQHIHSVSPSYIEAWHNWEKHGRGRCLDENCELRMIFIRLDYCCRRHLGKQIEFMM